MNKQKSAHMAVLKAIKSGVLTKSRTCQTCGKIEGEQDGFDIFFNTGRKTKIVGHHHRGYDHPLDVWWVCMSCNRKLIKHDGSVSIQEAILAVKHLDWFKWELDRRNNNQ